MNKVHNIANRIAWGREVGGALPPSGGSSSSYTVLPEIWKIHKGDYSSPEHPEIWKIHKADKRSLVTRASNEIFPKYHKEDQRSLN